MKNAYFSAALIALFNSGVAVAQNLPPILDAYPRCEYQILDTATATRNLGKAGAALDNDDVEKQTQRILSSLIAQAQAQGADALILTDRDLLIVDPSATKSTNFNSSRYNTLSYQAEFIRQCEEDSKNEEKLSPYNALGKAQKSLSLGSFGGHSYTLKPIDVNKRIITQINDYSISVQKGAYGLRIGDSNEQVEQLLGTPTFSVLADEQHQLLAYGRSLWLILKNQELVYLSTEAPWISSELSNLLAFDERFDDVAWQLNDLLVRYRSVNADVVSAHSQATRGIFKNNVLRYDTESSRLSIDFTPEADADNKNATQIIPAGFRLIATGFQVPVFSLTPPSSILKDHLSAYMQGESEVFDIDAAKTSMIGEGRISKTKTLRWYGGHIFVEMLGNSVNSVHFIENPLKTDQHKLTWKFNAIEQYDSQEKVLEILGDEVFSLGDTAEINGANYTQEFVFYEIDDEAVVISSKITLY